MNKPLELLTLVFLLFITGSAFTQSSPKQYSQSYLLGKFDPAKRSDFVMINQRFTSKKGLYLNKEAYQSFKKMFHAAQADGVHIFIVSATRNFTSQKYIWEAKWNGQRKVQGKDLSVTQPDPVKRAKKILLYSSMPGTSRHHWGTDIDLNNLNDSYFQSGTGARVYQWLTQNAHKYGFYQVYTPKPPRLSGYEEEKWHWTYAPLSKPMLKQYREKVSLDDIKGFQGYDTAFDLDIIKKYVEGINPALIP